MRLKLINLSIIRATLLFSFISCCTSIIAQPVLQHRFNFKGFSIIINDDASDENNNHLLVGEIRAIETEAVNRDTNINRIFDLVGYCNDNGMGIIIATDKDYNIMKVAKSFRGEKVIYDRNKKQFTIGAIFFDYLHVGNKDFSAWQPVIIQLDLALNGNTYFIQKPYSCILDNIVIENNEIIIFTRSNLYQENSFNTIGKADVLRINTSKFHMDSERPWIMVLEPIVSLETPTYVGNTILSSISKVDSAYYFTTSNLDQFNLKQVNHLYQFKNNKLAELIYFSDYLEFNIKSSAWININEFTVDSTKKYLFLIHEGATKKEMIFAKTDTKFKTLLLQKIPLNDYADFNKMLLLSNGNILILMANNKETWSYFLYDSNLKLINEINSNISKEYNQNNLKAITNNRIECFFNIDKAKTKDCVLQIINLN